MTFNNIEEVEKYVLEQARRSLITVQEEVYMIVNRFVKQYYAEFSPEVYERTYQLYKSLVKSEIKKEGNGYTAYVYFDLDKLDYEMKRFTKWQNVYGAYVQPYTFEANADGWFQNDYRSEHSEEKTLHSAMVGDKPHGGYKSGTAIWKESVNMVYKNIRPIFKKYLKQNGIPIK